MVVLKGRSGSGSRCRSENPATVRFSLGSATHFSRGVSEDCSPKGKTVEGARPRYVSVHHGLQPDPDWRGVHGPGGGGRTDEGNDDTVAISREQGEG